MAGSIIALYTSFHRGLRLVDGGEIANFINLQTSTSPPITALAGGGVTGAPVLVGAFNKVAVVANNNDSVALPPAIPGMETTVNNAGASTLAVWPNQANANNGGVADQIVPHTSNAAGASTTQATTLVAKYACFEPGIWKQMLGA